jgi:hypothetical protein
MVFLEFRIVTISPSERIESSAAQAIARLEMQRTTVQAPIKNLASLVRQRRLFVPCADKRSRVLRHIAREAKLNYEY